MDVAADVEHVMIDPGALEQLLIHLTQNAHDAMGDTGVLRISAAIAEEHPQGARPGAPRLSERQYISLKVSDDGPGIAAEVLEKIFDPFYSTKAGAPRGLGLAMCWGLVEQAGGTIQVNSSLGQGTTFEVLLPHEIVETRARSAGRPPTRPRGETLRILVVDDDSAVRHLVAALLKRDGHEAMEVPSGSAALAEFSAGTPIDLVLSDLLMPEMTGLQLVHLMRKGGYSAPFLVMSGYAPDHRDLREVPPSCLLSKPFSPAALKEAIEGAFEEGAPQLGLGVLA